jgi:hypothetical protein
VQHLTAIHFCFCVSQCYAFAWICKVNLSNYWLLTVANILNIYAQAVKLLFISFNDEKLIALAFIYSEKERMKDTTDCMQSLFLKTKSNGKIFNQDKRLIMSIWAREWKTTRVVNRTRLAGISDLNVLFEKFSTNKLVSYSSFFCAIGHRRLYSSTFAIKISVMQRKFRHVND